MDDASLKALVFGDLELDQPIFRIFPLWIFEEALRLSQLYFVMPHRWDDPFEDLCTSIGITRRSDRGNQVFLDRFLNPTFAQCWSTTCDSDVLLRAYSMVRKDPTVRRNTVPALEGVLVESTPRALIGSILEWLEKKADYKFCIGKVRYLEQEKMLQLFANKVIETSPEEFGRFPVRAESLLFKRLEFRHESEVRIILVKDGDAGRDDTFLRIPINSEAVFQKVSFDPRLESFERIEREENAKKLGFKGKLAGAGHYQRFLFNVVLD